MRHAARASLITIALIASVDFASAQATPPERLNLSPAKEQAITQGLAGQPSHSVSGFTGAMGSKLPASEKGQPLPSSVQAQVPEAKEMLFVKLPDRIVLVDPDTQMVAEIIMPGASTTGSGAGSAPAPGSPSGQR